MRKVLGVLMNGVLTVCAVIVTGLVIRQEFFKPAASAETSAPTTVPNWRAYAQGGHRSGPENAPVTMVVFSDFQCPACRLLAAHVKALRTEFPEQLAIIHRHSPLSMHPFAIEAARASECAAQQDRFSAFHDALFIDQADIGLAPWNRFAVNAGVPDVRAFDGCMAAGAPSQTLHADTMAASELKVSGTPTLLINDLRFTGTPPLDTLRAVIARAAVPPAE
ncbi:DsbA family protein [Longimicrobium sp.]|uniref:DsbA family protein n=1 Tax=Longimicrobium sp. TaxID=2029185 RepID=UPI002E30C874|nr:thioredoxin domain-containing protein [Longimicrobium sp.]HEX6038625.1 thioredoxin domain-containing protein [Longimicrobium sp.]